MGETMKQKLLETMKCALCHEILLYPKTLPCTHTFCSSCLDDILKFNKDGSATLECPNKCEGIVNVGSTMSINSVLYTSIQLQQLWILLKMN